ncbi:MAG: hypothetical protein LBC02_10800 [Planctomycetaceae bacterium]|jgi:hypothetical protein|nr:hypothetical protein [Planctomycetaceae bacterium]
MTTTIRNILFVFLFSLTVANGSELVPISVWTDCEVFPAPDNAASIEKMIDNNLDTHTCILDESRTGSRKETTPPSAETPITAGFVLDLGSVQKTVGIIFYPRKEWFTLGPKNVSVFACDDSQGKTNVRWLKENEELIPMNQSYPGSVIWDTAETRYIGVRVHDAYQYRGSRMHQRLKRKYETPYLETHFNVQIAETHLLTSLPDDPAIANPPDIAFPVGRLHNDWMMQDHGLDYAQCFISTENANIETAMIEKVLAGLKNKDIASNYRTKLESLLREKRLGNDLHWKELYFDACKQRRQERLDYIRTKTNKIVYAKHYLFSGCAGSPNLVIHLSDEQFFDQTTECRSGSQLCLIHLEPNGELRHEVLLNEPNGVITDPNISFDGETIVFSMRHSFADDDYHLYTMNLTDRVVKQITFSPEVNGRKYPCADFEPCFTPQGDIIFVSSRKTQVVDCWGTTVGDIFRCSPDGKNIQRLTYDELSANTPQITNDGRVMYARWEYSDRNAYYLHGIFTMNPDGTMQTEYCGNNSMYPASYLQSRPIPNSNKIVSIISGHHVQAKGKLALVDRNLGTQDGKGIEYVAGASPDGTPGRKRSTIKTEGFGFNPAIDYFGQDGPQYQYPFAFDEDHYLVAFCPEGWKNSYDGPYNPPMGIYFMTADGERELLAFDWKISSGHPIAVAPRPLPPIKLDQIDPTNNFGTFVVQDIYLGPGLKNIPRGTVKRLRVVALEYRAAAIGRGSNAGETDSGLCQTPISFNNGAWDVKHVLGEVDIEPDGSVAFQVPARTPVYFQLLDEKGYCVQTMRSWSTLQGGEIFACLGCHEDKLETAIMPLNRSATQALRKSPQKLQPFGNKPHPLMVRLEKENCLDSIENYWGVNAPLPIVDADFPVTGFSYTQEIQPILDKHCVACHQAGLDQSDPTKTSTLSLTGEFKSVDTMKKLSDDNYKRAFTQSYLALTNNGFLKGSRYIQWLEVRSRAEMIPPYHTGSAKSPLMKYLEPNHYGVHVSDTEKRTIACWIDLLIPFCGSYPQANLWTERDKNEYLYFIQKRRFFAEQELRNVKKKLEPETILTVQ